MTSQTNQTTQEAEMSAALANRARLGVEKARSKKAPARRRLAKAGKTATKRPPTKAAANRPAKAAESNANAKSPQEDRTAD